jgi:hypothetical protein
MHWPRRVSGLMIAVLFGGIGIAALRDRTVWWASGLLTLQAVLLSASWLTVLIGRGATRSACAGFAVFGTVYAHVALALTGYLQHHFFPPPLFEALLIRCAPLLGYHGSPDDAFDNSYYAQIAFALSWLLFSGVGGLAGLAAACPRPVGTASEAEKAVGTEVRTSGGKSGS